MKNICVAKEPLLLRFNTLAMCLFKYVFISYLKEKGSENTPPPSQKKRKKSCIHPLSERGGGRARGLGDALATSSPVR